MGMFLPPSTENLLNVLFIWHSIGKHIYALENIFFSVHYIRFLNVFALNTVYSKRKYLSTPNFINILLSRFLVLFRTFHNIFTECAAITLILQQADT